MTHSGHEATDASPSIALLGLGVLAAIVLVAIGLAAVFHVVLDRASPPIAAHRVRPPAPRLEVAGGSNLAQVRAVGARRLTGYGWTDRPAGLARIPLDRAMAITAQRGWTNGEARP